MCEMYILFVNELNMFSHHLPKEVHYRYFNALLPKRRQFFKYIKKNKDISEHDMECIMEYFEVGKKEALTYINILSDDQTKQIANKFKHGKAVIQKSNQR